VGGGEPAEVTQAHLPPKGCASSVSSEFLGVRYALVVVSPAQAIAGFLDGSEPCARLGLSAGVPSLEQLSCPHSSDAAAEKDRPCRCAVRRHTI